MLLIPVTLVCVVRGPGVQTENVSITDTVRVSLNFKRLFPPSHFGPLVRVDPQEQRGFAMWTEVIDPDYHGERELLPHNELLIDPPRPIRILEELCMNGMNIT